MNSKIFFWVLFFTVSGLTFGKEYPATVYFKNGEIVKGFCDEPRRSDKTTVKFRIDKKGKKTKVDISEVIKIVYLVKDLEMTFRPKTVYDSTYKKGNIKLDGQFWALDFYQGESIRVYRLVLPVESQGSGFSFPTGEYFYYFEFPGTDGIYLFDSPIYKYTFGADKLISECLKVVFQDMNPPLAKEAQTKEFRKRYKEEGLPFLDETISKYYPKYSEDDKLD